MVSRFAAFYVGREFTLRKRKIFSALARQLAKFCDCYDNQHIIIQELFSLAHDWSKRVYHVTEYAQLKLGDIRVL